MSIKGLQEALAKKQAQRHSDGTARDGTDVQITPTASVRVGTNKPKKKTAGRGR